MVGYFRAIHQVMPVTTMVDLRISVIAGGRSSFVQFDGDFTTADGRPYRNVYIWRVDWKHGHMTTIEEYANPVTFCRTFPATPT
jgi:ketosteroid isomerase-like protein